MWIDKKDKKYYSDSKYSGLRLIFPDGFNEANKIKIRRFCRRLSKVYWFPIRCKLYFLPQKKFKSIVDGHTYYGIFYSNDGEKLRKYPCIFIAAEILSGDDERECYLCIVHELTHYFQWYFYKDKEMSDRSMEINANKWARYIVETYEDEVLESGI